MPAEAYDWLMQVQTNLIPTILFPEASRLNVSKSIRHDEKLTGVLSHPLPTPRDSHQRSSSKDKTCHVCFHLSVSPSFCSLVNPPPTNTFWFFLLPSHLCSFFYSLSVSGRVVGCIEMKGWQEGWGCISTQRQQWKVMCGDKTSQWCYCVELGCLYYVLPFRRCLMSYPAGLWLVAEIGMIDFPTLHNAGQLKHDWAVSTWTTRCQSWASELFNIWDCPACHGKFVVNVNKL